MSRNRATSTVGQIVLTEDQKKFFGENNNFIDYFIEIGIKPNIFQNYKINSNSNLHDINSILYPQIISKFPNCEKESMGIDSDIISFVFPHGYKAEMKPIKPEPVFYSLILDNQFYSSVYSYKFLACLVIYESLYSYKKLYDMYSDNDTKNNSHIPQDNFKNIYVPKCLCLASVHPFIKKLEAILNAIYSYVQKNKGYFVDKIIEKLICSTPKIPRGLKKVFIKFSNNNLIELTQRKMNELISIGVDLKDVFNTFKIEIIVDIFRLLLLETKTIFFGSKIGQVTNTIMSFLLLLKPFTYQYQILSVLPEDYYFLLETNNPWIFGVNEKYYEKFFEDHKLNVEGGLMVIVDIDNKDIYFKYGGGNLFGKDFTMIPKHLKEKLDKRTEEYRKNKKVEETNEGYQDIFYRFMINLLKDYPKFLKKNYDGNSKKITDMIDIDGYVSSQNSSDRKFYSEILHSQMFEEFITKRMRPKDQRDKIQALFFEEKLNVKYAQKKLIRGNKLLEQNVLLPSKKYDYEEPKLVIDLSEQGLSTSLEQGTLKFFNKPNIIKRECLPNGFTIREDGLKGQFFFDYYIFPTLLSEKLFKFNCKSYDVPITDFRQSMEEINTSIINKCIINFDDMRKNYNNKLLNDIYISYLILFSLTFWYTDKEEREYRFYCMLQILDKIESHTSEVIELLFSTLVHLKEEDFAILLHTKYLNLHLNPTSKIFSIVTRILKKKQAIYTESKIETKKPNRSSMNYGGNRSMVYIPKTTMEERTFRSRTIKLPGLDDDILGEQIEFDAYGTCLDCKGVVNIEKICKELSHKEINKEDNRFRCNCRCNCWNLQKLDLTMGTELYNKNITINNSSSVNRGIILYTPTILKQKLLEIANTTEKGKFDVVNFRVDYPDEFWNAVWYFQLKGIDISFMLPYVQSNKIEVLSNTNKMHKYIQFVCQEQQNKNYLNVVEVNKFKNPNNKVNQIKTAVKKFNKDLLYIQHAYRISIINIIGMVMYKSPDDYTGNISFNEKLLLISQPTDERKEKKKPKPKKIINLKISKILNYDFNKPKNISTAIIENEEEYNEEEYNDLMDGNVNCDEYIDAARNKNNTGVPFQDKDLFEMMKKDDINHKYLADYKVGDGNDSDN